MTTAPTPTTRSRAPKKPADRQPSAAEERAERDNDALELIGDALKTLKPVERLRISEKAVLRGLILEYPEIAKIFEGAEDDEGGVELTPTLISMLEEATVASKFAASVDAWAESIAINRDAYVLWAEGKDINEFVALYGHFWRSVGE